MMMEVAENYRTEDIRMLSFDYYATNPLFVNEQITIHGHRKGDNKMVLWGQTDEGIVGMTGEVAFAADKARV